MRRVARVEVALENAYAALYEVYLIAQLDE